MRVEYITISSLQFTSAVGVVAVAVFGGAAWATRVSVQLDAIQKEISEIKTELKELKSTDTIHDKHLDRLDFQCCPKRTGQVFRPQMPAIISERRLRVKAYAWPAVPSSC